MMSTSCVLSRCAVCGLQLVGAEGLCAVHHTVAGEGWAAVNRIMCDFFHRGVAAPRLSPSERDGDGDPTGGARRSDVVEPLTRMDQIWRG
jgi:hypothetical protein